MLRLMLAFACWMAAAPGSAQPDRTAHALPAASERAGAFGGEALSAAALAAASSQPGMREPVLAYLEQELSHLRVQLAAEEEVICALEADLEAVRAAYAQAAVLTYRELSQRRTWAQLLRARSLRTAWQLAVYFRQMSRYRRRQLESIAGMQHYLARKAIELQTTYAEYQSLLLQLRELKALPERPVRPAVAAADRAKPSAPPEAAPAADLVRWKGLLPWPVAPEQASIAGRFGKSRDDYGNPVENDGIYLQTRPGQAVEAVFAGRVSGVQEIPRSGWMVVIEHGPYRSVYASLGQPAVRAGDLVEQGQLIGHVRTDPRTQTAMLHFLIYQTPKRFLDPEQWLRPKG
ncbi:MAG: M23 family metallopeptidase [Bacteroidia bacterium]|nr:M23 family metallopeptidase [Bacteroidia bacterium]